MKLYLLLVLMSFPFFTESTELSQDLSPVKIRLTARSKQQFPDEWIQIGLPKNMKWVEKPNYDSPRCVAQDSKGTKYKIAYSPIHNKNFQLKKYVYSLVNSIKNSKSKKFVLFNENNPQADTNFTIAWIEENKLVTVHFERSNHSFYILETDSYNEEFTKFQPSTNPLPDTICEEINLSQKFFDSFYLTTPPHER